MRVDRIHSQTGLNMPPKSQRAVRLMRSDSKPCVSTDQAAPAEDPKPYDRHPMRRRERAKSTALALVPSQQDLRRLSINQRTEVESHDDGANDTTIEVSTSTDTVVPTRHRGDRRRTIAANMSSAIAAANAAMADAEFVCLSSRREREPAHRAYREGQTYAASKDDSTLRRSGAYASLLATKGTQINKAKPKRMITFGDEKAIPANEATTGAVVSPDREVISISSSDASDNEADLVEGSEATPALQAPNTVQPNPPVVDPHPTTGHSMCQPVSSTTNKSEPQRSVMRPAFRTQGDVPAQALTMVQPHHIHTNAAIQALQAQQTRQRATSWGRVGHDNAAVVHASLAGTVQQNQPRGSVQPIPAATVQPSAAGAAQPSLAGAAQPIPAGGAQPNVAGAIQPSAAKAVQPCVASQPRPNTSYAPPQRRKSAVNIEMLSRPYRPRAKSLTAVTLSAMLNISTGPRISNQSSDEGPVDMAVAKPEANRRRSVHPMSISAPLPPPELSTPPDDDLCRYCTRSLCGQNKCLHPFWPELIMCQECSKTIPRCFACERKAVPHKSRKGKRFEPSEFGNSKSQVCGCCASIGLVRNVKDIERAKIASLEFFRDILGLTFEASMLEQQYQAKSNVDHVAAKYAYCAQTPPCASSSLVSDPVATRLVSAYSVQQSQPTLVFPAPKSAAPRTMPQLVAPLDPMFPETFHQVPLEWARPHAGPRGSSDGQRPGLPPLPPKPMVSHDALRAKASLELFHGLNPRTPASPQAMISHQHQSQVSHLTNDRPASPLGPHLKSGSPTSPDQNSTPTGSRSPGDLSSLWSLHMSPTRRRQLLEELERVARQINVFSAELPKLNGDFAVVQSKFGQCDMRKLKKKTSEMRVVDQIYIVKGLPRILFVANLCHELLHAYLFLARYPEMTADVEEGLCNAVAVMYLNHRMELIEERLVLAQDAQEFVNRQHPEARVHPSVAADLLSAASAERLLQELDVCDFTVRKFYRNEHPHYGEGFRRAIRSINMNGLMPTLRHLRASARLPAHGLC